MPESPQGFITWRLVGLAVLAAGVLLLAGVRAGQAEDGILSRWMSKTTKVIATFSGGVTKQTIATASTSTASPPTISLTSSGKTSQNSRRKPRPSPTPGSGNHNNLVTAGVYNGSATCLQCHSKQANEVMASEHAQWVGKLGKINDFCTFPDANLLFDFPVGSQEAQGCATCHVGFGPVQPPNNGQMQVQADKIDCLMCHSDSYNHVGQMVGTQAVITHTYGEGTPEMKNILAGIKRTPSKEACLKCHAKAGGGDGIKQGDLESTMKDPTPDLDVHMSALGANLTCVSCHSTSAHKIAGKGADLRVAEGSGMKTCTTCHSGSSHPRIQGLDGEEVSEHLAMADCKACHISQFARGLKATETDRDFSFIELIGTKQEAARLTGNNLTPKYLHYDGTSYFYPLGTSLSKKVTEQGLSRFLIAGPNSVAGGSSGGKYHPFKVHTATMSVDSNTKLIPIDSQVLWGTGVIETADTGLNISTPHHFEDTVRYMALYHQVAPADEAYTACNQCHAQVREGGGGGD